MLCWTLRSAAGTRVRLGGECALGILPSYPPLLTPLSASLFFPFLLRSLTVSNPLASYPPRPSKAGPFVRRRGGRFGRAHILLPGRAREGLFLPAALGTGSAGSVVGVESL